ncbi:MAG TPA: DUF177 domain-containing protein [Gaiellaceae bacterium]|nr:DUF177 domain-containing protein [Gaiellaceae bacterium]
MTTVDLRTLRLRLGEVRRETLDVEIESFVLGGQRYDATPPTIPIDVEVSQASGATVLDMRLEAHLCGACMRCLGFAEVSRSVRAREFHDFDAPVDDELRSEYVVDDHLQLSAWARDAVALELPEQILCREDCAGLCPVCGKDLNVEPHEHLERDPDPRWAALEQLRGEL